MVKRTLYPQETEFNWRDIFERYLMVFDLDNTLIDSSAKLTTDTIGAFARLGKKVTPEQVNQNNWYELANSYSIPKDEFDEAFNQRKTWEQSLADGEVPIFPETHDVLGCLYDSGISLGLLSKSIPEYADTKLDFFDLKKYFFRDEFILTIPPRESSKDSAAIELVKRFIPEDIWNACFIGDQPEDVTCEQAVNRAFSDYKLTTGGIYVNRQGQQLEGYPSVKTLEGVIGVLKGGETRCYEWNLDYPRISSLR